MYKTVFTISQKTDGERSHLGASPSPAEGLGANVGGNEVAVANSARPAEEVGQAVGHARGRVAGALLCRNAASGQQTEISTKTPRYEPTPQHTSSATNLIKVDK